MNPSAEMRPRLQAAQQQQHRVVQALLLLTLLIATDRLWLQDEVDWNAKRHVLTKCPNIGKVDQE